VTARPIDPVRLSKTLAFLLRHRPDAGQLQPDDDGWVPLEELARAASKLMRRRVTGADVAAMVEASRVKRFEIETERVRVRADRRPRPKVTPPDILYHAATAETVAEAVERGHLETPGRPLHLSADEAQAWRVAHRRGGSPQVLFVDTTRARRHGIRFFQNRRTGLYTVDRLPVQDVLNLQPDFAEQQSAGGVPVMLDAEGRPCFALIRVTRRSGVTWEVAKGKLEPGETPEAAGIREVQEEMGVPQALEVTGYVGLIRYGFLAPGGLPRLKSVYLYLMRATGDEPLTFEPRAAEGIADVRWFTPAEACRAVTHSSLRPIMRAARELVERQHGVG
jgi:putative RNA 2'-phosphotransferase